MTKDLGTNLGDLTGFLSDTPVADLSWLEITPGENYDNIPSENKQQVIPQLEEAWSDESTSSPAYLVPNKVMNSGTNSDKSVKPDDIFDVARVTKKAMMVGMSGKEIIPFLRERFPTETLKAASSEIRKIASEEGLLGNVYIDLSAFESTKEASRLLGKHKVRLASFAVGSPFKEKRYVDSFGKCLHLAKTVVDEVDYSKEVLAHYETHLKNVGVLDKEASLKTKEDLREAFLSSRNKKAESLVHPDEQAGSQSRFDAEEMHKGLENLNKIKEQTQKAAEQEIRLAQVKPVLAMIQNIMLKGAVQEDLKKEVLASCDSKTLQDFRPEIGSLLNKQGLVGPLFIDVSFYPRSEEAISAIKGSEMKPKFLINSMGANQGMLQAISSKTGIPEFEEGVSCITEKEANSILSVMHESRIIGEEKVASFNRSLMEGIHPAAVIKNAYLSKKEKSAPKVAYGQQAYLGTGERVQKSQLDRTSLVTASTQALEKGFSEYEVKAKLASLVPNGEVKSVMAEALSIHSRNKKAAIIKKEEEAVRAKMASVEPFKDPYEEFGVSNTKMDIDLKGLITPPKDTSGYNIGGSSLGNLEF